MNTKAIVDLFLKIDNKIDVSDLSEEEAGELVKSWLRRYGPTIVAGIVIALVGLFAINWWQGRERRTAHEYSYQLETLAIKVADKEFDSAKKTYDTLANDDGYSGNMAALLMAKAYTDKDDNKSAMQVLKKVLTTSKDQMLLSTARWQLANLQVSEKDFTGALGTLAELNDSAYTTVAIILKGDIYNLQGDQKQALATYEQAQKNNINNPLLEMKIHTLKAQQSIVVSQTGKAS